MLFIIRGLPGSGKSTLARQLAGTEGLHFESDTFFVQIDGTYKFDPKKLPMAHKWCQDMVRRALDDGSRDVYVSNTFTQRWEYQPYLDMAYELNVPVQVIEVHGDFGSVHNVPDETIQKMRSRWEPHLTT